MTGQISRSPKNHHHTGGRRGSFRHPSTRHFKCHTLIPSAGMIDPCTSRLIRFLTELWQALADSFQSAFDVAAEVQSDDASVFVSEGEEIAEAWARWSVANPYASPGIGRSSDASAVNMMKTPVFGPPLWSWPVECRYSGPYPSVVATL